VSVSGVSMWRVAQASCGSHVALEVMRVSTWLVTQTIG
jgi:hypothetical protein